MLASDLLLPAVVATAARIDLQYCLYLAMAAVISSLYLAMAAVISCWLL